MSCLFCSTRCDRNKNNQIAQQPKTPARNKLNLEQIVFGLPSMSLKGSSLLSDCPKGSSRPLTCYPGKYRSYSGHCNNVENAEWGAANSPFARWLAPRYADGVSSPRTSVSGGSAALPSARAVSLAIHQGHESPFSHMTTLNTFFGRSRHSTIK